jgi:hypothetical protein
VRAPVVTGRDLDVLMTRPSVGVVVLNPQIGKVDGFVEVWQVVFARPESDLLRLPVGTSIVVLACRNCWYSRFSS